MYRIELVIDMLNKTNIFLRLRAVSLVGLFAIAIIFYPAVSANENTFFRIVNEAGQVELKATITPEEAKRGYSVVTLGGHVIREVAAELSPEEYAKQSEQLKRAAEQKAHAEAEQKYDETLLFALQQYR